MTDKDGPDQGLTLHTLEDLTGRTPEELRQIVDKVDDRIRELHQTPTGELRDLSEDEGRTMDLLLAVRDKGMAKIAEHSRITDILRNRPQSVTTSFAIGLGAGDDPYASIRSMNTAEARDRALRILESRQASAHMSAAQKDEVDRQVRRHTDIARRVIVTENDDYRAAFTKLMTNPRPFLTIEEQRAVQAWEEYRAMSEGTTTAGGFGIPVNLAA